MNLAVAKRCIAIPKSNVLFGRPAHPFGIGFWTKKGMLIYVLFGGIDCASSIASWVGGGKLKAVVDQ